MTFTTLLHEPATVMSQATAMLLTVWAGVHAGCRAGLWLSPRGASECGWCQATMGGFAILTGAGLIDMPAGALAAIMALYGAVVAMTALIDRLEPQRDMARRIARLGGAGSVTSARPTLSITPATEMAETGSESDGSFAERWRLAANAGAGAR
jgi:hypothetical protein